MTSLVPADSIETIVGRRRHPTDHTYGDTPVKAGISRGGLLIPTGWAEP